MFLIGARGQCWFVMVLGWVLLVRTLREFLCFPILCVRVCVCVCVCVCVGLEFSVGKMLVKV